MRLATLVGLPRTVRNLQRLREIVGVVAKYGFGDLVARLDLFESSRDLARSLLRWRKQPDAIVDASTEARIRMALEELGPTFVKLGQILATRPDLIPMSLILELRKLQDHVPPFSPAEARRQVETELGRPIEAVFERFATEPLAAASIAQVHRARLLGGDEVVVKVRRPGLTAAVRTDVEILQALAELAEENAPELRQYSLVAIADEFARAIGREIDLSHEAANMQRFARNFADDAHVRVPRVYPEASTGKVLTMEFIDGVKATDLASLDAQGIDRKKLAQLGVDFCLKQVFEHGFFHADPHPGNIFVLPGEVIAPLDMGMMGTLEPDTIDDLLVLLAGVLLRDVDKLIRLFLRMGLIDDRADVARLRRDLTELIDRYASVSLASVDVSAYLASLFEMLQRYHVVVPSDLLLIAKAMSTVEGMARELAPDLDPMQAMRPYILQVYLRRLSDPRFLARDWIEVARSLGTLVADLPGDLHRITRDLRRGDLTLSVRAHGMDGWVREQARGQNRVGMSILVASVVLGSSWMIASGAGPELLGLRLSTWLGLFGLGTAGIGYLPEGFGFLRSGRF